MSKTSTGTNTPVSWQQGMDTYREAAEYGLKILPEEVEELLSLKASIAIADEFAALATVLMRAATVLGPRRCVEPLQRMDPLVQRVSSEFVRGVTRHNCIGTIGVLGYLNFAQCCGVATSFPAQEAKHWLPALLSHRGALTEFESQTLALACLASEDVAGALAFLDDPIAEPFIAGQVYGPSAHGFCLYLAAARQNNASAVDVAPAWEDFLLAFPRKLASQTLRWDDLVWAARGYFEGFDKRERTQVMGALHQSVLELVS